jgi:methionine-R-sulfoxide reductase
MQSRSSCCCLGKLPWLIPLMALCLILAVAVRSGTRVLAIDPPKTTKSENGKPAETKADEGRETAKVIVGRGGLANPKASSAKGKKMNEPEYNKLTAEERWVLLNKGTEYAFTGKYTDHFVKGTYICKRCNNPLYKSDDKFHSGCGWPAFDDEIKGSIHRETDADGFRIEIMCKNCGGHLGHVFNGEKMTRKDTRHCVNSISIKFVPEGKELPPVITAKKTEEAKESDAPSKAEDKLPKKPQ